MGVAQPDAGDQEGPGAFPARQPGPVVLSETDGSADGRQTGRGACRRGRRGRGERTAGRVGRPGDPHHLAAGLAQDRPVEKDEPGCRPRRRPFRKPEAGRRGTGATAPDRHPVGHARGDGIHSAVGQDHPGRREGPVHGPPYPSLTGTEDRRRGRCRPPAGHPAPSAERDPGADDRGDLLPAAQADDLQNHPLDYTGRGAGTVCRRFFSR